MASVTVDFDPNFYQQLLPLAVLHALVMAFVLTVYASILLIVYYCCKKCCARSLPPIQGNFQDSYADFVGAAHGV